MSPYHHCWISPPCSSTTRGIWSRYFSGTWASNIVAGSQMWSSTLMSVKSPGSTARTVVGRSSGPFEPEHADVPAAALLVEVVVRPEGEELRPDLLLLGRVEEG